MIYLIRQLCVKARDSDSLIKCNVYILLYCNPGSQYDNARACAVFVTSVVLGDTQLVKNTVEEWSQTGSMICVTL